MRLFKRALLLLALLVPLATATGASALNVPPKPTDIPIIDQADVLSPEQEQALAAKIAQERTATGNQIGILVIKSLEGDALEDYSIRVAREWGIGTKEKNNGVLLLVATDDRRLRIEVGYGLEGALTDLRSGQIIRDRITPEFRNSKYYEGINLGLDGIIAAIHNENDQALNNENTQNSQPQSGWPWELIIFGLLFIPSWIGSILARTKSWWAGGVIGGIVGLIVSVFAGFLITGLLSIIGLTLIGLLFDRTVSSNYRQRRDAGLAPSWWAGGTHLGGGGGSGGFGGFGGGSFGGGGSSGSW